MGASQSGPVKEAVTLPVVWLPEADVELQEARERYDSIRPELGLRFAAAVSETIDAIADSPFHYAVVQKGRRRAGVRRFPYGIFYLLEDNRVVVIACFHGHRNPKRWQRR